MTHERNTVWRAFLESHPWARSLWRPAPGERMTLLWLALIHFTALVGLLLTPLPSWHVFGMSLALTWIGGIGTTVCYHRGLAHRSVVLHPAARTALTFFAMLNGSGAPISWVATHRLHHATSDTVDDVSSPGVGGFWWAHLRWIWQVGRAPVARYCPDMDKPEHRVWDLLQPFVLALSYFGGIVFGLEGFFWIGAIRLVFALHGQCFVNSICHMAPGARLGTDSSRNVAWLAGWHLLQGENWHKNHHDRPWSARLGWTASQVDLGWWTIVMLERLRLAQSVRRPAAGIPLTPAATLTGTSAGLRLERRPEVRLAVGTRGTPESVHQQPEPPLESTANGRSAEMR